MNPPQHTLILKPFVAAKAQQIPEAPKEDDDEQRNKDTHNPAGKVDPDIPDGAGPVGNVNLDGFIHVGNAEHQQERP